MEAGTPQQPDNDHPHGDRARLAAWSQVVGAILVVVTLTCSLLNVISVLQAIALAVPAVLLIIGGLIAAAAPDPTTGHRFGFRVGLGVGSLLGRLRSFFRRPGGGLADVFTFLSRRH